MIPRTFSASSALVFALDFEVEDQIVFSLRPGPQNQVIILSDKSYKLSRNYRSTKSCRQNHYGRRGWNWYIPLEHVACRDSCGLGTRNGKRPA